MNFLSKEYVDHVTQINPKHTFYKESVFGSEFYYFDDILSHPEEFREFLEYFPAFVNSEFNYDLAPGSRQHIPRSWLYNLNNLLQDFYQKQIDFAWATNIYSGNMPSRYKNNLPHVDYTDIVANLWLNTECHGGTGFYAYDKTYTHWKKMPAAIHEEIEGVVRNSSGEEKEWKTIIEDDQWCLYYLAEMKYNRLTLYDGNLFHSAYLEKDWYIHEPRYSLIGVKT
jgi:hypothetical protein